MSGQWKIGQVVTSLFKLVNVAKNGKLVSVIFFTFCLKGIVTRRKWGMGGPQRAMAPGNSVSWLGFITNTLFFIHKFKIEKNKHINTQFPFSMDLFLPFAKELPYSFDRRID